MKTPKFWVVLKINGTIDLLKKEDGEIKTFLTERDADQEAGSIVKESNGSIKCLIFESKWLHVFNPKVDKILLQVLEAEHAKSGTVTVDLRSLSYEPGDLQ